MKESKLLGRREYYGYIDVNGYNIWHRLDGPAVIEFDEGETNEEYYYIHDVEFTEEEFNNHPEVVAYRNEKKLKEKLEL